MKTQTFKKMEALPSLDGRGRGWADVGVKSVEPIANFKAFCPTVWCVKAGLKRRPSPTPQPLPSREGSVLIGGAARA